MMNKTIRILRAPVLQACCRRGARIRRTAMLLLATLLLTMTAQTAWADTWPEYITDVILVGGTESEVNAAKAAHSDYTFISQDLNKGCGSSSDYIYLGYKKGYRASTNGGYITDIIVVTEGSNAIPTGNITFSGRTYNKAAIYGGDYFVNSSKGDLNSHAGGWGLWLYYTKANFSDKRAISSISFNGTSSGSVNCYKYWNEELAQEGVNMNRGCDGGDNFYMHLSTATKTNRPSADPVMASGLTYNDGEQQLIATAATLASGTMYYRIGTSGSFTSTVADVKATAAGSYTVYYYAGSNSYSDASSTHSTTVSIGKSANSGVTVSCADIVEGNALNPQLGGTNLSTGAVTYKYCTTQNGTYTTTAPTAAGTYYVKATVAADGNCNEFTTAYANFKIVGDWALHNSGDSEADAYVISTTDELDLLAQRVNSGTDYKDKFFKLDADITYSHTTDWNEATSTENNFTPIGNVSHTFKGTFDGNGKTVSGIRVNSSNGNKGLFGSIYDGATVKNVILSDARIIGYYYCGGIAGKCEQSTITNCWVKSNVCIGNRDYNGGIAGYSYKDIISGCRSEATLTAYASNKMYYGGIAGKAFSSEVSQCVVVGATIPNAGYRGAIVGENYKSTLTSNYYTACTVLGVANAANVGCQGGDAAGARQAVAIGAATGVTVTPTGTATTYDVSSITAYASNSGLLYNGQLYAGNVETVKLDITYASPYEFFSLTGYTDGNGHTLTHVSGNTYKLQMPATTVSITPEVQDLWGQSTDGRDGSTAAKAFRITTPAGLDLLAKKVTGTDGYTANNYSGKYFELGADIDYSEVALTLDGGKSNYAAIGYYNSPSDKRVFSGHFDGLGHKISGIVMDKTANNQGIFACIEGAEVKNLNVTNVTITIGGDNYNVGGIVGFNANNSVIENCHVTASVTVTAKTDGSEGYFAGGIVGDNSAYVRGCTSAASVSAKENAGAIAGIHGYGTIENCLVLGANVTANANGGAILGYLDGATLANNRYTGGTKVNNGTAVGHGTGNKGDITDNGGATVAYQFPADIDNPGIMGTQGTTYGTGTYQGITAYENGLEYDGKYYWHDENLMELADRNEYNSSIIADNDRKTRNVVLKDRTLYKDGSWNTLCLPFSVSTTSGTLSGDNVQAMTLNTTTSSLSDGTLTLNFTAAETIPAGTPFIIKWDESGTDIENPVFDGVTIDADKHDATVEGVLTFTGTYAPVTIDDGGDNTKLYLGSANTLYYPTKAMTIGTHRAYFQLADGITAGEPVSGSNAKLIRAFALNFGDDEATGIISVHDSGFMVNGSDAWYTLDGRRLDGQPTAKGLYIHGGKKVIVK